MKNGTTWRTACIVAALAFALAAAASAEVGMGLSTGGWFTPDFEPAKGFFDWWTLRMEAEISPFAALEARASGFETSGDWKEESAERGWRGDDFKLNILALEIGPVLKLPLDSFSFYGGGGIGAYLSSGSLDVWAGDRKHNVDLDFGSEIGAYAVGGIQFFLTDTVAIFGEVRYTWLDAEMDTEWWNGGKFLDGKRVSFDGFGSNLGVMVWF